MNGKKYISDRGWKYQVMGGIGQNSFKGRYQKPEKHGNEGWKGMSQLVWRDTFEEAQSDLDRFAEKHGWKEWGG